MGLKLRSVGVRGLLHTIALVLVVGEARGAQLTASWVDSSSGVATTRLERRLGAETLYAAIAEVPPGVTAYVDASVSPGTTYCYRAFAYDATRVSPYSGEMCAASGYDPFAVTVGKTGSGAGTVASIPAGILCGTACSAMYSAGTSVTLAANPVMGSVFAGWAGACAGSDTCTLVGNVPVNVTASFDLVIYPVSIGRRSSTGAEAGAQAPPPPAWSAWRLHW